MENPCPDIARGACSSQGCREDDAAADAAGKGEITQAADGKKAKRTKKKKIKKNRTPSIGSDGLSSTGKDMISKILTPAFVDLYEQLQCDDGSAGKDKITPAAEEKKKKQKKTKNCKPSPVLGSDGRDVVRKTASTAWTCQHCTKDGEQYEKVVHHIINREPIEGLDWSEDKLSEKTNYYLKRLNPGLPNNDDEDFWAVYDEPQLTELNERLADLKEEAQKLSNENHYTGWYFDPEYCNYVRLQDYQRLMLPDNGVYEDWEYFRETCSTLECDQEFVQYWEKLSSETKRIADYLTAGLCERERIEIVAFYHAVKIAAEFANIFKTLIESSFTEYTWSVRFDNYWYNYYFNFYYDIWKRVAKEKMGFKDALRQVYESDRHFMDGSGIKAELASNGPNPGPLEHDYETYFAKISGELPEGEAERLIMETVKKIVLKHKIYIDYAKTKLGIAKEIGICTSNPHKSSTGQNSSEVAT
uniref:Uncharacterized protein n=1 Tax=Arundo donax TaxID=35708 RepID=A0A0A8XS28_ARUDO